MAEDAPAPARRAASPDGRGHGTANSTAPTAHDSFPPLRNRPLGRSATFADRPMLRERRRSSMLSDFSLDDTRHSVRSSTDDLLLPKPPGAREDPEPSHWQSVPLVFALLPAIGGLLFKNGSAVVTDVTLLGLAAIFLNWSIRLPWDWYRSTQSLRVLEEPDHFNDTIFEEDSEDEAKDGDKDAPPKPKNEQLPSQESSPSTDRSSAVRELQIHEILALTACFLGPLLGSYLLHTIRSQLSRPSEGLVSNYNLTIFLLASELRPFSHLVKLVQSRTIHLQRIVNTNPYDKEDDKIDPAKVLDLSKRLEELEAHIAGKTAESAGSIAAVNPSTSTTPQQQQQLTTDLRRNLQPDLDALNRAVRRYEKRATVQTMQTESRLQDLEARLNDALSLAAAAASQNRDVQQQVQQRTSLALLVQTTFAFLVDNIFMAMMLPLEALWTVLWLPVRMGVRVLAGFARGGKNEKREREREKERESLGKSPAYGYGSGYGGGYAGRFAGDRVQTRRLKKV
ncbi:MAG: hypothetical protein M1819_007107 [Sarea resinae]|nr:MAG: hypothetical protein M1819_007107 [Sarea resinae]